MSIPGYVATATSVKNPNGHIGLQINITHPDMATDAVTSGSTSTSLSKPIQAPKIETEPATVHHNYYGQVPHGHGGIVKDHGPTFWDKNKKGIAIGVIVCTVLIAIGITARLVYNARKIKRESEARELASFVQMTPGRSGGISASDHAQTGAVVNPLASAPLPMMTTVYQPMFIASSPEEMAMFQVPLSEIAPATASQQLVVHKAFAAGLNQSTCSGGKCPPPMPSNSKTGNNNILGTPYRGARR